MEANKTYTELYLMTARSELHAGGGINQINVDIPIQREAVSHFPVIENRTIKGMMTSQKKLGKNVSVTDFRILLFPIASVPGIFSYLTCPKVLERLVEALKANRMRGYEEIEKLLPYLHIESNEAYCFTQSTSVIRLGEVVYKGAFLNISAPAIFSPYQEKLLIVSDDTFYQVILDETEVITRNKLNAQSLSENVFTKEYLPQETVLYGFVHSFIDINSTDQKRMTALADERISYFLGADRGIGKGEVRLQRRGSNGT